MNKEFYEEFHQKGGSYLIPTEIFNELLDELEETIELQQENEQLKEELKKYKKYEDLINDTEDIMNNLINGTSGIKPTKGLFRKGDSNE